MTSYVGEEYRISSTATDFDHTTALTPDEVANAKVYIYKPDRTLLINGATMTYDADLGFWYYLWDTSGEVAGTYRAKVVITSSVTGKSNWEWHKIRLARDPVPVP